MVDIEKMVLAGPCSPKFSLSTSSFFVNTHTRIKTSLLWHIMVVISFFKIVDNVTLLQELFSLIGNHLRF